MRYEYKIIPAPQDAPKIKGMRDLTERFVHGLTDAMNEMGAEGWEYLRLDRMQVRGKRGLLRRGDVTEQALLVFRRPLAEAGAPGIRPSRAAPEPILRVAPEPAPAREPVEIPSYSPEERAADPAPEPAAEAPAAAPLSAERPRFTPSGGSRLFKAGRED